MSCWNKIITASVVAVLASAPALADHPRDMEKVLPAAFAGDLGPANDKFLKDSQTSGRNQLLFLYELGALNQVRGNFARSIEFFNLADSVARAEEAKALVSATGLAAQAGAALTNDTTLPWTAACFDKVMARTLNAINYLALNKLEDAKVEVKKAEEYQAKERMRIQGKVNDGAMNNPTVTAKYNEMYSFTRDIRNSYENAFTYYLSSLVYKAHGSAGLNDAMVDIKQAMALAPGCEAIQAAYLDLVALNGDPAALEAAKAQLQIAPNWMPADPTQTGTVVVIFQPGMAPRMWDVSIDLFVGQGANLMSMAFPIYREFGSYHPPLRVLAADGERVTSRVVDLRKMAVKALQERMPEILARNIAGGIAKVQVQKKAEERAGFFGKLASQVATKLVTTADLRSWLSLPAEIQAAQFNLPIGRNDLTLSAPEWMQPVSVEVAPGATTLVLVRSSHGYKTITSTRLKADL